MLRIADRRLLTLALAVLAATTFGVGCSPPADDTPPESPSLFDGKSIEGWVQRGGEALYAVEDGAIVGRTVLDTPNSFLCPPKDYDNFLLEFEVKVDPELNSGVQIRSHSTPEYRDGRVHGYQVEIDPTDRGYSGGVYDEGRRGWLQNPEGNAEAMKAFKGGEWNKYEVEAIGDRIKTWVNGVPVTNLVDGVDRSGFIGFQVHSAKQAGLEVRWRNVKLRGAPAGPGRPVSEHADRRGASRRLAPSVGWQHLLGLAGGAERGVPGEGLGDRRRRPHGARDRRSRGGRRRGHRHRRPVLRLRAGAGVQDHRRGQQRDQVLRGPRAEQQGLGHRPRIPDPRRRRPPGRGDGPGRQSDRGVPV